MEHQKRAEQLNGTPANTHAGGTSAASGDTMNDWKRALLNITECHADDYG